MTTISIQNDEALKAVADRVKETISQANRAIAEATAMGLDVTLETVVPPSNVGSRPIPVLKTHITRRL